MLQRSAKKHPGGRQNGRAFRSGVWAACCLFMIVSRHLFFAGTGYLLGESLGQPGICDRRCLDDGHAHTCRGDIAGQNRAVYLTNDKMPPMAFLDNIPSWELGVVNQVRDLGRVMRDDYTRSQSQSKEDETCCSGRAAFSSLTTTRGSSHRQSQSTGTVSLRLSNTVKNCWTAIRIRSFYARADNLREWLSQVEKRLGSLTRRLGNSVASDRINDDLAGDPAAESAGCAAGHR